MSFGKKEASFEYGADKEGHGLEDNAEEEKVAGPEEEDLEEETKNRI